jgi:hypothetical protein
MIKYDTSDLTAFANMLKAAPRWHKQYVNKNMVELGRRVAYVMQQETLKHRYTGSFSESIQHKYTAVPYPKVEIGPTVKRGKWDGGLILEYGTGPIPRLPFKPIARWAEFRGLPAGPVWYSIKTKGVKAHPFLQRTLNSPRTQVAIRHTAERIGIDLAGHTMTQWGGSSKI